MEVIRRNKLHLHSLHQNYSAIPMLNPVLKKVSIRWYSESLPQIKIRNEEE